MEMGDRISAEDAYQMIKEELEELKKGSEIIKKDGRVTEQLLKIGKTFGTPRTLLSTWMVVLV